VEQKKAATIKGASNVFDMVPPSINRKKTAVRFSENVFASYQFFKVTCNAKANLAPLFTGVVLAVPSFGLTLFLAEELKVIYDLWMGSPDHAYFISAMKPKSMWSCIWQ
jgi:hypothetical protein